MGKIIIAAIGIIFGLALVGLSLFVTIHFLLKYW